MTREKFQPVIKWTGSKRKISFEITRRFPGDYENYYEPFVGGGSVLFQEGPESGLCLDICEPLIGIWKLIKNEPENLISYYKENWKKLQDIGHEYYYEIREKFNDTKEPEHLYFLSRTCVNGLIRFNQDGEFNNSFHHSRPGIHPKRLSKIIREWSQRIENISFKAGDYAQILDTVTGNDFVYMDPPYFNTTARYYGSINEERFFEFLSELNDKNVRYALSLDGFSEVKDYRTEIPDEIYEEIFLLKSGKSSFKKVMDKEKSEVKESLYLNYEFDGPDTPVSEQTELSNF